MLSKHAKDLTGYISGYLEVISYIEGSGGKNKHTRWLCYCRRCGNYTEVDSGHLTSNWRPILSCGCLRTNPEHTTLIDLKGEIFGCLLVESLAEKGYKNHPAKWNCLCICGTSTVVRSSDLRSGKIISCGCKFLSKGELAVNTVLNQLNIKNKVQYNVSAIKTKAGGIPRMDFAILNEDNSIKAFIEFQGVQHYKECNNWGTTAREETDFLKKVYCFNNNIPLFEVRYNENPAKETLKILETLKLIPCQAPKGEGVSTIP